MPAVSMTTFAMSSRSPADRRQRGLGVNGRNVAARTKPSSAATGGHKAPDLEGRPARELSVAARKAARQLAQLESHRDFSPNDFDETLPGPFEWDLKRLAASMPVAGRDNGLAVKQRRRVALATAAAYRTAMREFAATPILNAWYARPGFGVHPPVGYAFSSRREQVVELVERLDAAVDSLGQERFAI